LGWRCRLNLFQGAKSSINSFYLSVQVSGFWVGEPLIVFSRQNLYLCAQLNKIRFSCATELNHIVKLHRLTYVYKANYIGGPHT